MSDLRQGVPVAPDENDLLSQLKNDADGAFATNLIREFSVEVARSKNGSSLPAESGRVRREVFRSASEIVELVSMRLRSSAKS